MKVTPPGGIAVDLGKTEATPTIGIVDYSRRETDAFGVTTVVRRDFSRRMSVKLAVPTPQIDDNMRLLATLRAKAAQWVADPRYAWLNATGYYEDLSVDLPYGDLSYCTLTVAGLAERETVADAGGDPSANGRPSTLRFVEPVAITDTVLVSSSVAEDDAGPWSASATYGVGATVVRAHRVYESLVASNVGHDPVDAGGQWLDTGPTKRWAMFDQALGSATIASAAVGIVLKAATATSALALLDTNAATVRVQSGSYDRTVVPDQAGKALFLDFAAATGASVTVTITPATSNPGARHWDDGAQWLDAGVWQDSLDAGDGTVTVGTFLFGALKGLGTTEASPTAGITDYSVKERDQFGEVTIVERAWAKNMAVKAQIASSAVDVVANRIAAVRATPALWIGDTVRDSLIVYGFFRDFSIEIGESVSKLSLSIEGLSKAAPIAPPSTGGSVAWPDITDPTGTKPTDNATVGMTDGESRSYLQALAAAELARIRDRAATFPAPDGASIYTLHRREEVQRVTADQAFAETFDLLGAVSKAGTAFVFSDQAVFAQDDAAGGTSLVSVSAALNRQRVAIEDVRQVVVGPSGAFARAMLTLDVGGRAIGYSATNDGKAGGFTFVSDRFSIETPAGRSLFFVDQDGAKLRDVEVDTLKVDSVDGRAVQMGAAQKVAFYILPASVAVPRSSTVTICSLSFVKEDPDSILEIQMLMKCASDDDVKFDGTIQIDGMVMDMTPVDITLVGSNARLPITPFTYAAGIAAGPRVITFKVHNRETDADDLSVLIGSALKVTELRKPSIGSITGGGGALPTPGSGGTGTGSGGGYNGSTNPRAHNYE